jgi:hypothetical protein
MRHASQAFRHPLFTRRRALQAGAASLLGLGMNHLAPLRAAAPAGDAARGHRARTCIYIFLSGGLSQIDSFDPKPDAPAEVRGEFGTIPTRTPGVRICEHLPRLAARSHLWSMVRSLTHRTNDHSAGHLFMLTGRGELPAGFDPGRAQPSDWPSIAAVAGAVTAPRNNLPPAAILPDRLLHNSGRAIPGPYAGQMGRRHDPWLIECSPFDPMGYGAYPQYEFDHQERPQPPGKKKVFAAPSLSLPEGLGAAQLGDRLDVLHHLDAQRHDLEQTASAGLFDVHRQTAVSLLTQPRVRRAIDVRNAEPRVLDRYGNNLFGWVLLMARRLVEAGVNLVQVNLGNNETWDTHGEAFPHLKDKLLPPMDRAVSALLDDLADSGLLECTLVVMAGEFGRTPKISHLPQYYKLPGRDHWGAVQTVFFAGGGVIGGRVVGSSDRHGGHPASDPQTPENMAATIYQALGIPATAAWHDALDRPHHVYYGAPIRGLLG